MSSVLKTIACGISGGVDSAVAAHLLKEQGHKVIGVFMKNWDARDELGSCPNGEGDLEDAQSIADHLQIDLLQVSFEKSYWNNVFNSLLEEYANGLTPNPDILCNKFVKFGSFYNFARTQLQAHAIATGHYARTSSCPLSKAPSPQNVSLLRAIDLSKDQTLFLSQVEQRPLSRTIFPLGRLLKSQVRSLAKDIGLDRVWSKRDSTGICFIGRRKFSEFIRQYLPDTPGHFIHVDTGQVVGEHLGVHHWTLGQRIPIGGLHHSLYIALRDAKSQIILVAPQNHPILYSSQVLTTTPHWIQGLPPPELTQTGALVCLFKFQHTEWMIPCRMDLEEPGRSNCRISLAFPTRAITPGQYAVFYKGEVCLGSAKIISTDVIERYAEEYQGRLVSAVP